MKAKVFIAAIILIIGTALTLQAQDTSAQQSRKAKLEREIALLDKQLSENASKSRSALSELNLINSKISARKELISESEKQIAALVTEKAFPILPVAAAAASALVILLGVIGFAIRRAKRKKARFDAENIK